MLDRIGQLLELRARDAQPCPPRLLAMGARLARLQDFAGGAEDFTASRPSRNLKPLFF